MEFVIKDGVLKKYTGSVHNITIPDNVSCIDASVFKGNNDIKSVVIPQSVSTIKAWAFAECESLEKVQIMGKTTLEKGVFYRCTALKELTALQGLQEIGNCAFMGCKSLESDALDNVKFDLWTLMGVHDWGEDVYPSDETISKCTYTWREYQRITAEILPYALITRTEHCNELEGPEDLTVEERNAPITDDLILVYDAHFWGCLFESEDVYFCPRSSSISQVILRPNHKSVYLFYMVANHMPFYACEFKKVVLREYSDNDNWVGKLFSYREFIAE